jgi:hypothetical protein
MGDRHLDGRGHHGRKRLHASGTRADAGVLRAHAGRGAAMGIYSMLLGLGALGGSLLAAALGQWLAIDGLILGTLAIALAALLLLNRLHPAEAFYGRR